MQNIEQVHLRQPVIPYFSDFSAVAVLGIALIAMGEDIGADMSYRTFGHLVDECI